MSYYCQRCGTELKTYNPRRKWCSDCRKELFNERARLKTQLKRLIQDNNNPNLDAMREKLFENSKLDSKEITEFINRNPIVLKNNLDESEK